MIVDKQLSLFFYSYFNVLLCRHDHEGAEDAEMGTYTFGNIFSLDKRIKFNVSRLVLCHRKMYESTECLGHGHERCQRQRKIFPVFSRTTHFPWESNKGLLVLAIHLLPRKRGNIILKNDRYKDMSISIHVYRGWNVVRTAQSLFTTSNLNKCTF